MGFPDGVIMTFIKGVEGISVTKANKLSFNALVTLMVVKEKEFGFKRFQLVRFQTNRL